MQSKAKPPVPPKPCYLQLNHQPSGSPLKRNKEPPPTLPKPQRLIPPDSQVHSQGYRLEECAVKENLEQDREGESSGVANGAEENHSSEKEVLQFDEVEHEERVDDKMSSVRRSRSSNSPIMRRTDYRRRAIKRNNSPNLQADDTAPPAAPPRKSHLVPKSQSANIPSSNHPRRFKPISCPPGDAKLSDDDIIDSNNAATPCLLAPPPTQQQPLSSDDEASSGSSSEDEDKTENGCSDKKPPKSYFIAKELMTTERTFVDVLKLLHHDLRQDVEQMNKRFGQPVIPDEVYNRIFGCFPQLHALNEVLLHEIEQRIEHWNETPKISDIIVKHGPFLKIYTSYFKNYSQLIAMLDDACKKYPLFGEVLKDFEMKERCKKLEVKHYMLKPVQRIPQYRLLLTDYLKHIDETSPDYADTQEALNVVSKVAEHANDTMKETEKFAKLLQLQNLFASYQVVKPGRLFVCEGDLYKLCRKGIQSRRFILFSDCLLHCSVVTQGQLRVHHELPLSDMKVQTPKQVESPTEFSVVSVARSFTLAASSIEEREAWLEALNKAIAENECKRKTFLQAKRQNQIGVGVSIRSDERLGQKAPIWVPDSRVTMCHLCMREFTLTFRRHHCRACGKVICSLCSANRAPLFYLNYQPARVCYECYHILQKEIDAQDRLSVNNVKVNSDSEEGKNKEEPLLPSIENLRAQFKQLSPIVGEPKKIYVPKVLQEVSANDTGSTFSGYLNKKVKRGWKRQWFVVKDKVLYSYKASEDVAALESIVLLGFVVTVPKAPLDGISPSLLVELQHKGRESLIFYADSESVTERWLEAFRQAVVLE